MRVFLLGYMGCGKSSKGSKLAKKLNLNFFDLDILFEEKYKLTIQQFFSKYGENLFRKLEHKLLKEILHNDNFVLSLGGGSPCFYDNMNLMNESGITVYIKMPVKALQHRLTHAKKPRPLIENRSPEKLESFITNQLSEREIYYSKAHLTISGINLDIDQLAKRIITLA
ncbi:MAG: shikimate kinase [Bacteroidales bacterium]|nr:shikimate kinase [Bacteroidales bacterium]